MILESKMQHIYQNIDGWFSFAGLYSDIVNKAEDGARFVEVGTWLGRSASYMAVEIINSGKNIKFDCVDTWKGSLNEDLHQNNPLVKEDRLYDEFLKNIDPVRSVVNPVRLQSVEAANLYEDNSLDFVFIDASHDYENVKNDIAAWYPKIKNGGILAGHDYPWDGVKRAADEFSNANSINLQITQECWVATIFVDPV